MKYLCLAYFDERKFSTLDKAALQALVGGCAPHDAALKDSGQLMWVASLGAGVSSVSLRPQRGATMMSDGPFCETKEQVGALFMIEARDLNEAIRVAGKHPAAHLGEKVGWGIEIRPVEFFELH